MPRMQPRRATQRLQKYAKKAKNAKNAKMQGVPRMKKGNDFENC